mgnify:CR=1 FL=1
MKMGPEMNAKMQLKWFPEVGNVFTYAAAKSEHFRAFALYMFQNEFQTGFQNGL